VHFLCHIQLGMNLFLTNCSTNEDLPDNSKHLKKRNHPNRKNGTQKHLPINATCIEQINHVPLHNKKGTFIHFSLHYYWIEWANIIPLTKVCHINFIWNWIPFINRTVVVISQDLLVQNKVNLVHSLFFFCSKHSIQLKMIDHSICAWVA